MDDTAFELLVIPTCQAILLGLSASAVILVVLEAIEHVLGSIGGALLRRFAPRSPDGTTEARSRSRAPSRGDSSMAINIAGSSRHCPGDHQADVETCAMTGHIAGTADSYDWLGVPSMMPASLERPEDSARLGLVSIGPNSVPPGPDWSHRRWM